MTRSRRWLGALSGALVFALACGDSATEVREGSASDEPCVPEVATFTRDVKPLFERYCTHCHAEVPVAGAPFGLVDYDAIVARSDGGLPIVEALDHVLASGAMPPGGHPQPTVSERAQLRAWATCTTYVPSDEHDAGSETDGGAVHEHDAGPARGPLEVNREPIVSGAAPASEAITVTLDEFTPPLQGDHYQSRVFANLVSEDRFIRYFEPVVDDARVVHHLTLRFGGSREGYVYVWAPGGGALELPDGGIRIGAGDSLRLEVHYHNGSHVEGVRDSSGVRLYVDEPVGTEYGVANLASWDIYVPARGRSEARAHCDVPRDVHVFAALPHMHEVGDSLSHDITRVNGDEASLIALTGWEFHTQRAYAVGVDLKAGDKLDLTCRYANPSDHPVVAGTATTDEMCFDFLYVTPPDALAPCNDVVSQ